MRIVLYILIICFFTTVNSQNNHSYGWLPKVNVSTKLNTKLKWVQAVEVREMIYEKNHWKLYHKLLDYSSNFTLKTNYNQSLSIGYVARFSNKNTIHRLAQYYNYIANFETFKLANRVGFEQFYAHKTPSTYRIRHRFTFEKPLQGTQIDVKEFYLKLANEYLYHFNKKDLEIRVAPYVGYKISKNDKLEFGFDYRVSKFKTNQPQNSIWLRTTWYIAL